MSQLYDPLLSVKLTIPLRLRCYDLTTRRKNRSLVLVAKGVKRIVAKTQVDVIPVDHIVGQFSIKRLHCREKYLPTQY